jgi:hypothetical protein
MLKNITFSADKELIQKARQRAAADQTTLNDEFREWLQKYAERPHTAAAYADLMKRFGYVKPGRSFHREEMNER